MLETQMQEVRSDVSQIRADIRKLVWLVIGAIIVAGANFVVHGGLVEAASTLPKAASINLPAPVLQLPGARETAG